MKNTGRMGYITSNTWLDVGFGEGLKRFFLEHFKILAIIEHDAGVFEKAEGETFKKEREDTSVRFIRIKKPMDIKDLIRLIEETEKDYENDSVRVVLRK